MTRGMLLGVVIALGAVSMAVGAAQGPSEAQLDAAGLVQVKDNLYYIAGEGPWNRDAFSGGNVGVFIASEGVTIVDTKLPGWGPTILDRIRTVTDKPVVAIINTHTHGDHVGSNSAFPDSVNIIAHENTKANMEGMDAFQGDGARFLPDTTYSEKMSIGSGDGQIDLYHFGPGHTNGDTFIVFPALGVMHTGDMFAWKDSPFMDRSNGGSGVAYPETLAKAVAGIPGVDTVIPGHIPMTSWSDFVRYQRFNADVLAAARTGLDSGQSAEEAMAAFDLSEGYPDYRTDRLLAAFETIYAELQE